MTTALKTRPADLLAFKQFAQERTNLLLCIETSFGTQDEAKAVIAQHFPSVKLELFIKQKNSLLVVFLSDPECLDAFLESDWLLTGLTSIAARPSTTLD